MKTIERTKIVRFAGKDGKINIFSIDKRGNVRQLVKGDLEATLFRPVSERVAEHVCLAAKVKRPSLDSEIFRQAFPRKTYVRFINGHRV